MRSFKLGNINTLGLVFGVNHIDWSIWSATLGCRVAESKSKRAGVNDSLGSWQWEHRQRLN